MFRGKRGGQVGIGLLVGLMDISTANNTVAIVMAGPIAKEIAAEYGISPQRSASLLDTFSCDVPGHHPSRRADAGGYFRLRHPGLHCQRL